MADGADDEGHLGGGIDQSAGRQAPALDNSCPAVNPSQVRRQSGRNRCIMRYTVNHYIQ